VRGLCPICCRAIERGDGLRWITLYGFAQARPVHSRCFERGWEFIEAGLEPFPLHLGRGTSKGSSRRLALRDSSA
jgi:hypothetical protein